MFTLCWKKLKGENKRSENMWLPVRVNLLIIILVEVSPTVPTTLSTPSEVTTVNASESNSSLTSTSVELTINTYLPTTEKVTSSVPVSPTLIPLNFTRILDNRPVYLQFSIAVQSNYTADLQNGTMYNTFEAGLSAGYNSTPGFMSVTVIDIRNGNGIVDYNVWIRNPHSVKEAVEHINETITDIMNQTSEKIDDFEIDKNHTRILMEKNISTFGETGIDLQKFYQIYYTNACKLKRGEHAICQSFSDICLFGYNCTFTTSDERLEASCQSKCLNEPKFCGMHGECYIDYRSETLKCRCEEEMDYIYIGERCCEKMELVKMKKEYIILLASCTGGFIILALIMVIICLLKRSKLEDQKRKQKEDGAEKSTDRFRESRSFHDFSDHRGKQRTENHNQSQRNTRYLDGREHQVLRNEHGEETFIYQPSNVDSTDFAFWSQPSVCNSLPRADKSDNSYTDISSKYEIKRPHVNLGRNF